MSALKEVYEDIGEIIKDLEVEVTDILNNEISEEVKDTYEDIAEKSYSLYEPINSHTSRFREGETGSLADKINYTTEISKLNKDTFTLTMENDRTSDCGCSYCESNETFLDYYADLGIAGIYQITEKHITEDVQEKLDNKIEGSFYDALSQHGW